MKPRQLIFGLMASCLMLVTLSSASAQPRRRSSRVVTSLTDVIWSVKFSPDSRTMAIARGTDNTGRVELWEVATGTLRHSIKGFDGTVWSVSFAPDGRTLVSASGGIHSKKIQEKVNHRHEGIPFVELKWWDVATGELQQRVELPGDDRVSLMAFHSPDGKSLATVAYRAALAFSNISTDFGGPYNRLLPRQVVYEADFKLLNAANGEVRLKLRGNIGGYQVPLFSGYSMSDLFSNYLINQRRQPLTFSPDGQLVAAWSGKEVKIWNTSTGEEVRRLKDFKGRLGAATFSPDGHTLVAAITNFSYKNDITDVKTELHAWDVATGVSKQVLPVITQLISSLAFAPNGQQLIIGGVHREDTRSFATLEIADLQTGSQGLLEAREEGTLSSVNPSPDGQVIAFQTDVSSVRLIDALTWKTRHTFDETSDSSAGKSEFSRFILTVKSVIALSFTKDGKSLAGGIEQGGVKLWDTRTGEVKKQWSDQEDPGSMAAVSSDGKMLVEIGGDDEKVRLWNLSTGEQKSFAVNDAPVAALAISSDGQRLAAAQSNLIVLLDTTSGSVIQKLSQRRVDCLSFSADGRTLAASSDDGTIQTWDYVDGQVRKTIAAGGKITAMRIDQTGRILASAGGSGVVSLWDLQTGSLVTQLKKHSAAVNAIAFSSDGSLLATGGDDRSVIIWETASGKAKRTLKGHDLSVTSLAFSSDASLLASGAGNASVVLWDVGTGKLNRVLK